VADQRVSINRVILVGTIGRDAELRYGLGGSQVAGFPLGTVHRWTDTQGQNRERIDWHMVNVWGELGVPLAGELRRGRRAFVEGRIEYRPWVEPNGESGRALEIRADRVVVLGAAPSADDSSAEAARSR
jgi:single-strand DNA-binding protein